MTPFVLVENISLVPIQHTSSVKHRKVLHICTRSAAE